jgi:hypothetical protein
VGAPALRVDISVSAHGPDFLRYVLSAHFDRPDETMAMTVVVPNGPDQVTNGNRAIARARELARLFASQP